MDRVQETAVVVRQELVAENTYVIALRSPEIAKRIQPGQFLNIKAMDQMWGPFLRRPFSVSAVDGEDVHLLFNVVGSGTRLLASRHAGDLLDVLGPLGKPFGVNGDFGTAILVAGGLGLAPFPFLERSLRAVGKESMVFAGVRTASQAYTGPFKSVHLATDDGSAGYHGTVVELMKRTLSESMPSRPKIFGCGPTRMLKALSEAAISMQIPCEISLEGDMACGIGLCQGCPVRRSGGGKAYALVCTEGPTFDCTEVTL